ncbi:MAG: LamG domain-containing protein [Verrucomicrobiales bacterium]|nr:LamG domain-containing protein [Verrucomicrobiales bacterium]
MNRNQRLKRVNELTSLLLDRALDESGQKELNEILRGDPDACERYLDLSEAHAALIHDHLGDELIPELSEKISPFPRTKKLPVWIWAAAAAIAFLALNTAAIYSLGFHVAAEPRAEDDWVAVVSRAVDPVWNDSATPIEEGDALPAGKLSLESGLVQIEFFSGASVIVEGPASLDLRSPWLMECTHGRLRTFVPEPAQGFTIVTPEYHAVDLGTEFALSVSENGQSELHVVDGEVRLDNASGEEIERIEGGGGIRSSDGKFENVSGGGGDFIGRERLLDLAAEDRRSRLQEWRMMRREISTDPDTLVFFDFEDQKPWDRQLTNKAANGSHAAIIGAEWSEGRWPGKGALAFKRITDRVRLEIPGKFDALTYSAWVRIEGLDRWLSSLMLTDGFEKGEVHWQISDSGELVTGIKTNRRNPNTTSPPLIKPEDLGRWIHLATTLDRNKQEVIHYLDGEAVIIDHRTDLPPLTLGASEIGNWQPVNRDNENHQPLRSFNGRIDEFTVLKRALTPTEVATLFEAGK